MRLTERTVSMRRGSFLHLRTERVVCSAALTFDLDGGVGYVETQAQHVFHVGQRLRNLTCLLMLHTCRSCTSLMPGTCRIWRTISAMLICAGAASIKMPRVCPMMRHAPRQISSATTALAIGSSCE